VTFKERVSRLAGVCPALDFRAGRWQVVTDARTRFTEGECGDLRNGMEAEIDGDLMANGVVLATRIELEDR
jgi:hypothetical protein